MVARRGRCSTCMVHVIFLCLFVSEILGPTEGRGRGGFNAKKSKKLAKRWQEDLEAYDTRKNLPFVLREIPCNDIVLVKTMKCASSTFTSILLQATKRCAASGNVFKFTHKENSLKSIEEKARPKRRYSRHYYRPSKYHKGGADAECRSLATKGPEVFFGSRHKFANNLQTNFLGSGRVADPYAIANQYDLIVVQDKMRESLTILHFYGVLSVRDMFFISDKNRTVEKIPMSPHALKVAKDHNEKDYKLWKAVNARHDATVALFNGLGVAAERWETRWKIAQAACSLKMRDKSGKSEDECLDAECARWEPCRANNLALGLPGVGLTKDLRKQDRYLRNPPSAVR